MTARPFCRRCLLADMPSQAEMAATVRELIDLLPAVERADRETVALRLARCKVCDHLTDGMCALCGCYVELRSAKRRMGCPDVPERWGKAEGD